MENLSQEATQPFSFLPLSSKRAIASVQGRNWLHQDNLEQQKLSGCYLEC